MEERTGLSSSEEKRVTHQSLVGESLVQKKRIGGGR